MNEESYMQKWQELEDEKEQKEYEKEQRKKIRADKKAMKQRHDEWERFKKQAKQKNLRLTPQRNVTKPKPKPKPKPKQPTKTTIKNPTTAASLNTGSESCSM